MTKQPKYYDLVRDDLFPFIPPKTRSILDLGCGAGATLRALKDRGFAYVAGVEVLPEQVAIAKMHADRVLLIDLNLVGFKSPTFFTWAFGRKFDVVLMADILEHLPFPGTLLNAVHGLLEDDGVIIISLPNSGWVDMVNKILNQDWTLMTNGHFDHTHMRFFCRENVRSLLQSAGYEILKLQPLKSQEDAPKYVEGMSLKFNNWQVNDITEDHLEQLMCYQWLCVAKKKLKS